MDDKRKTVGTKKNVARNEALRLFAVAKLLAPLYNGSACSDVQSSHRVHIVCIHIDANIQGT